MYRMITVGDQRAEVCDACGFNGAQVQTPDLVTRLGDVPKAWRQIMSGDQRLLRARPSPATWCAIEYCRHTAMALIAIEWAAGEFIDGRAPDFDTLTTDWLEDATADNHNCAPYAVDNVLDDLEHASASLVAFTQSLSDADLEVTQDYGLWRSITTGTVIRHALHDAEHHILDVRQGLARQLLTS